MIEARFRMALPADVWVADVSTSFPAATFRLLTGAPLEDRVLELGEVRASNPKAVAAAVERHPDVLSYDQLHIDDRQSIAQYETVERQLYEFLGDSSLPPEFPLTVENGWLEFDVTVSREQFEAIGSRLDASGLKYELLSVVEDRDPENLLTDRQRECLTIALRQGYFEVPRDCTLAEVAETMAIDKSTASETLRRGSARILKWFLITDNSYSTT